MLNKAKYFYRLQNEGSLNKNWMLNSHDFSIWNIETNKKLEWNTWSNRINWNKGMDY